MNWAASHSENNPGHLTRESIKSDDFDPGSCTTCGAKSPAWQLEGRDIETVEVFVFGQEEPVGTYEMIVEHYAHDDHERECCREHGTHSSPHVGCILR